MMEHSASIPPFIIAKAAAAAAEGGRSDGREGGGKRAGKTRMMVAGMGSCGDALQAAVDRSGNKLETERFHCLLLLLLNSSI